MSPQETPRLVEALQVKCSAQAGVFVVINAADGSLLFAPMESVEARTLAANLIAAADALDAHRAASAAPAATPDVLDLFVKAAEDERA